MAALVDDDQPGAEGTGAGFRRGERDRILSSVDNQRRRRDASKIRVSEKIIVTQALPDRLLNSPGDTKWRQVVRGGRIRKVAGNAKLEAALTIRVQVALTQARPRQLVAERLHFGAGLP